MAVKEGRALVLGGGGLLGAMFEIGALAALEEIDESLVRFDLIVGTSGGAVVGSLLAAGFTPRELRARAPSFASRDLAQVCWRSVWRWVTRAPGRVVTRLLEGGRLPSFAPQIFVQAILEAGPSGLLSLEPLRRFLICAFEEKGIPDRFASFPTRLLIPAIDLDWGDRLVFGGRNLTRESVSSAVVASASIPGVFRPVRVGDRELVDGGLGDTLHLDLAFRPGISDILAIHALVAPINDGETRCLPSPEGGGCARVSDLGFTSVTRQSSKIAHMQSTTSISMLRAALSPNVSVHLLQPDRLAIELDDLMDFSAASRLLQAGADAARRFARQSFAPQRVGRA